MEKLITMAFALAPILIGGGLISTALHSRSDYDTSSFIATLVVGGIMVAAGVIMFFLLVIPAFKESKGSLKASLKRMFIPDRKGQEDRSQAEERITGFKQTYREYFISPHTEENSTLQNTTTQMFWHTLFLQKKRMLKKGVTMDFQSERMRYGGKSVSKRVYSDSRYVVTEINERIKALRTYRAGSGKTYRKKNSDLAHYTLANARTTTANAYIICPNCGNETTRANLLDGCDYCGTKFMVEDLGRRVSSFVLRNDLQTALEKYSDIEETLIPWMFVILVAPISVLSLIGMLSIWKTLDAGLFMKVTATVFAVAFLTGIAFYIAQFIVALIVEPLGNLIDNIMHTLRKKDYIRQAAIDEKNEALAFEVKRYDKYFSRESFYSNVQNKLAAIHYADTVKEAQVFTATDIADLVARYQNVIDMEITDIHIRAVDRNDTYQTVKTEATVNLIYFENNRFRSDKERLVLSLQRNAHCKTAAVCAPSFFKCKGCGNSVTLLNGGLCEYCGAQLCLAEYDWVISDYQIA